MNRCISVVAVLVLMVCITTLSCTVSPRNKADAEPTPTAHCPPLPVTFKESDLIGTWMAKYGAGDTDTLILRQDGTYRQIYSDSSSGLHFESGWQEWWTERRVSGFLRLHLKGMRRCDDITSLCNREGGGLAPDEFTAIDYCEGEVVEMPNEIVLIVTGVPSRYADVPRSIWLRHMRLTGAEWTYTFELQEKK
jgi:hypothetical protein